MRKFLIVVLVLACCSSAEARWRLFPPRRAKSPVQAPVQAPVQKSPVQKVTDQEACQQKANLIARLGWQGQRSHYVLPVIGRFEGIGYGPTPNCATCVGSGQLTGDAVARGANGMFYRVRSWR